MDFAEGIWDIHFPTGKVPGILKLSVTPTDSVKYQAGVTLTAQCSAIRDNSYLGNFNFNIDFKIGIVNINSEKENILLMGIWSGLISSEKNFGTIILKPDISTKTMFGTMFTINYADDNQNYYDLRITKRT